MATFPAGFTPPPPSLVHAGALQLGRWTGPPARTNLIDARYRHLPRALRNLRLKEWQAVQVTSPTLFVNVALVNTKMVALVRSRNATVESSIVRLGAKAHGGSLRSCRCLTPAARS